jgi:NAD(P)-dependent dehydrogenase (short-subunit alcohol dehydrogenase family)
MFNPLYFMQFLPTRPTTPGVLDERQAMKELAGKVAIITGSASGIGLATVRALGREGMKVVMADVNETLLQEAADACLADGLTVHPVTTDVSDFNAVRHLADVTYDTFGAVHVLHLNAGIASGANLFDEDTSSWRRIIDINLLGVVWGIKAFLPRMKQADQEAVILATSSGAGAEGTSFRSTAYAATKLAVVSVMESLYGFLREEQSPIHAGVVFPPLTATRLGGGDPANMKHVEQLLRSQGVPAVLMEPEQVAGLILDGIKRDRFFIRVGAEENKRIFNGSQSQEYFDWNARMIRGRAEAQLADGKPDEYLW